MICNHYCVSVVPFCKVQLVDHILPSVLLILCRPLWHHPWNPTHPRHHVCRKIWQRQIRGSLEWICPGVCKHRLHHHICRMPDEDLLALFCKLNYQPSMRSYHQFRGVLFRNSFSGFFPQVWLHLSPSKACVTTAHVWWMRMRKLNHVFVTCQTNRNLRSFPFHLEWMARGTTIVWGFRITLEFLRYWNDQKVTIKILIYLALWLNYCNDLQDSTILTHAQKHIMKKGF